MEQGLDRSKCALKGRGEGDDPATAKYTCEGCGTVVIGFGRWRNHMKRSQKHKGVIKVKSSGTPEKKARRGPCFAFQKGQCSRGDQCRFSHDPNASNTLAEPAGAKSVAPQPKIAEESKAKAKDAVATEKEAASGSERFLSAAKFAGARPGYVFKAGAEGLGYYKDAPAKKRKKSDGTGGAPTDQPAAGEGSRWLGGVSASGKRQRKFF